MLETCGGEAVIEVIWLASEGLVLRELIPGSMWRKQRTT